MGREEDGLLRLTTDATQQLQHLHFAGVVEKGGGLVEEDDRCLLGQGLGYHHLLSLTVAQRVDHAQTQCFDANLGDGLVHHAQVVFRITPPEAGIGRTSEADEFAHRHIPHVRFFRQHHANLFTQLFVAQRRDFPHFLIVISHSTLLTPHSSEQHLPADGGLEGREGAQQRRLAHAVGAQQTGKLSAEDAAADAFGHRLHAMTRLVADAQIPELYGLVIHLDGAKIIFFLDKRTKEQKNMYLCNRNEKYRSKDGRIYRCWPLRAGRPYRL